MDTNEKNQLSPAERRRRMEMRKRRQLELKRKKRRKILIGAGIAAVIVLLAVVAILILNMAGGSYQISAKGSNFVIVLDPGHGGEDTGMSGASATEKEIDLKVCEKLKIMLESQGYEVLMTREDDSYLSKEDRVAFVNEANADLLVSVHCAYSETDASMAGAVSSYQDADKQSKALAENIQESLIKETGAADQGVYSGDYTILGSVDIPAVLVEAGYLSNETEAASLAEDVYQNDVAKGIAKGIIVTLYRD